MNPVSVRSAVAATVVFSIGVVGILYITKPNVQRQSQPRPVRLASGTVKQEIKQGAPNGNSTEPEVEPAEFIQEAGPGEEVHIARSDKELAEVTEVVIRESYVGGINDVDFSRAIAKSVLHVTSECPEIPDYSVVTVYIDDYVAGNVIWLNRPGIEFGLGLIQPFGPAYVGATALEDHAKARELSFPPVSVEQAARIAGVDARDTARVYTCPTGQARHPLDFEYEFPGQAIRVGAVDGALRGG